MQTFTVAFQAADDSNGEDYDEQYSASNTDYYCQQTAVGGLRLRL